MSKPGDPRLGSIIQPGDGGDIVIVGFPHDQGTVRNGGRPGARNSPAAFRRFLYKMGCLQNMEFGIDLSQLRISDAGDVLPEAATIEEAHEELRARVRALLAAGKTVFVVGGSNDQSSSNGKALLDVIDAENKSSKGNDADDTKKQQTMVCINIDAHFDVRPRLEVGGEAAAAPLIHSGCPFRDLLEDGRFDGRRFGEFAAQGSQCSAEHFKYLKTKGASVMWHSTFAEAKLKPRSAFEMMLDALQTRDHKFEPATFVSFDIDAIAGADCPGVSCPGTVGISAQDALDIARVAGKNPSTRLFDLSEMNVAVEDYRTPRLAVNIFYFFLLGVAAKKRFVLE